ncbi:MAG: hypothetical protein WD207_00935, partial [Xanthobacteraceae bacterium]
YARALFARRQARHAHDQEQEPIKAAPAKPCACAARPSEARGQRGTMKRAQASTQRGDIKRRRLTTSRQER